MTTITGTAKDASGAGVVGVTVTARLVASSEQLTAGGQVIRAATTVTAAGGAWSLTLTPITALAYPVGAYYRLEADGRRWTITVPPTGSYELGAVLVTVPDGRADTAVTSTALAALTTRVTNVEVVDAAAGVGSLRTLGTGALQAAAGSALATHVADVANPHAVTKAQVGLGSVDNTADAVKPVSTAQQAAVDLKVRGGPHLRFGPGFLPRWRKSLANVRNGAADAKLLCIGDSTTGGVGDSTQATIPVNKAYPAALANLLNTYLVPTAHGLAVPRPNSLADDRWLTAAGWTPSTFGMGGNASWLGRATAGVSTTFNDPRINADRFDVYYVTFSAGGTLGLTATGGGTSTINTGTASGVGKVTLSAAAAATSNTVTATQTGGDVYILGIEPWLSTAARVRVGNAGVGSSQTAGWIANQATFGAIPTIKAYAPNLAIISLGINDANASVSVSTYLANLQLVIDAAAITADVILLTPPPSNPTSQPTISAGIATYVPALNGLTNYAVADLYTRSGGWTTWNANGFQTDSLHPNDFGYWDIGQLLFAGLSAA